MKFELGEMFDHHCWVKLKIHCEWSGDGLKNQKQCLDPEKIKWSKTAISITGPQFEILRFEL